MKYTVSYSDNLPEGIGGVCYYPFYPMFGTCKIVIRPKYKDDTGLLNHELCHARQYADNFFQSIMYKYSKGYRLKCEIEAYREQVKAYGYTNIGQAMWIVNALHSKYDLDMTISELTVEVKKLI